VLSLEATRMTLIWAGIASVKAKVGKSSAG
jgi:hypothetical protein